MSEISLDVKARLAENAAKRKQESQTVVEQTLEQIQVEQPAPVASSKPEEAVPPVEEPKLPAAAAEEKPVENTTTQDESELQWDTNLEPEPVQSSAFDIKKFGSALSLDVSSEEELVKTVGEKFAKLKELETSQAQTFEGVPDELKEAIDIAKKGGDWASHVSNSTINVAALNPLELFDSEFERLEGAKFKNPDGSIDYQRLDEAIDSIPEAFRRMRGEDIKRQIAFSQNQRREKILSAALAQQEAFQKQLGDAAKELPGQFPKETYGITVEPKHVSSLYEGIANQKLIKKHLGNIDPAILSKLDAKKLMKTLAIAEWGESISKFQRSQGITEGKKSILNKVQNPQITSPGVSAAPELTEAEKPKTSTQKLQEWKNRITGGSSL